MQKILYTINFLTNGGPTRVLENIIKELDTKEYNIYILTLINENDEELINKFTKNKVKVIALNYNKSLKEVLKNRKNILNKIKEINPNIIHTHGIISGLIINTKKLNAKSITTIHNNIFEDYSYTYGKIKGKLLAYTHILALKKYNHVICCSASSYEPIKRYLKNATYIRNGIDIEKSIINKNSRAKIRESLKIPDDSIIYIYGGVINSRKNVLELIKDFNPTLKENEYLIIVGDGPLKEKAERKSTNNHIIFTGFKSNIVEYLRSSDVYVSASLSEGFSISIIEALECGLLLLIKDIPSHKECFLIDNNYYIGEYFNEFNFAEKKNAVANKLKNKNNVKEFKEKYLSAKVMANEYQKYYRR